MTADLKGWQPDPFGIHELRFFSADGKPTRLVRDNDVESYDEPPTAASNSMSDPVMTRDASLHSPAAPDAAGPPASIAHSVTPAGWFPDPKTPKQQRYWDGMSWTEHTSLTASFLAPTNARSGRLLQIAVAVTAVLLVAEVIGLVSLAGSSKMASNSPAHLSAITATTAQSTESVETGTATTAPISSTTTTQATQVTPPSSSTQNTPQSTENNVPSTTATDGSTDPTIPSDPSPPSTMPTTPPVTATTPPSTTSTTTVGTAVAAWYATSGEDIEALSNDIVTIDGLPAGSSSLPTQGRAAYASLATDAARAAAAPAIPDASIQPTWQAATGDLLAGAQKCIQAIAADDANAFDGAEATIETGAVDLTSVIGRIEADVSG